MIKFITELWKAQQQEENLTPPEETPVPHKGSGRSLVTEQDIIRYVQANDLAKQVEQAEKEKEQQARVTRVVEFFKERRQEILDIKETIETIRRVAPQEYHIKASRVFIESTIGNGYWSEISVKYDGSSLIITRDSDVLARYHAEEGLVDLTPDISNINVDYILMYTTKFIRNMVHEIDLFKNNNNI